MDKMRINEIVRHHQRGILKEIVGAVVLAVGLVAGVVTVTVPPATAHAAPTAVASLR